MTRWTLLPAAALLLSACATVQPATPVAPRVPDYKVAPPSPPPAPPPVVDADPPFQVIPTSGFEKLAPVQIAPETSYLTAEERQVVNLLMQAAELMNPIYLEQNVL